MLREQKLVKVLVKQNNKAQALVEFVILLPIFLMILFIIIDFANVFYNKNHLEGTLDEIVDLVENSKESQISDVIDDEKYEIRVNDNKKTIVVSKDVKLITPVADLFFKNPYTIKTERTIINE